MANSETNTIEELGVSNEYQYGFHDDVKPTFKSRKGLDEEVINQMCDIQRRTRLDARVSAQCLPDFQAEADDQMGRRPFPTRF